MSYNKENNYNKKGLKNINKKQEKSLKNAFYGNEEVRLIVSKKEIKDAEKDIKLHRYKYASCDEFIENCKSVKYITSLLKAAKCEVERMFEIGNSTLQQSILYECNMAETIARKYGLNNFINARMDYIPEEIRKIIRVKNCRYIYYNPNNLTTIVAQYGSSKENDVRMLLCKGSLNFEIKDGFARAGESDSTYFENGKLPKQKDKGANKVARKFNKQYKNGIYSLNETKQNAHINDKKTLNQLLDTYFSKNKIDVVFTDDNGVVTPIFRKHTRQCFAVVEAEIRRTGKNVVKVFNPKCLLKVLDDIHAKIDSNNKVRVYKRYLEGQLNKTSTRIKLSGQFIVRKKDVVETDEYYEFNKKDIKQNTTSISVKIKPIKNYNQLKEFYS